MGKRQPALTFSRKERKQSATVRPIPRNPARPLEDAVDKKGSEKDKAFEWIEKGVQVHDPALPYLGYPCYDIVRPEPRFQDLLRKMNLPTGDKK